MLRAAPKILTHFPAQTWPGDKPVKKTINLNPKSKLIIYKSISLFVCVYKTIGLEAKKGSSIIYTESRGDPMDDGTLLFSICELSGSCPNA